MIAIFLLKTLGLAACIFGGIYAIFFGGQLLSKAVHNPAVDKVLNPPVTPYNYKESELWEAPAHWKQWKNY